MRAADPSESQTLVLLGGGHTHSLFLKSVISRPLPNTNIVLVSDVLKTPYSGMLPGHVAGVYDFDETHIDLERLARAASAELIVAQAIGIDPKNRCVKVAGKPDVSFDYLSINIGSTPDSSSIEGADAYVVPVKPVSDFLKVWKRVLELRKTRDDFEIVIVGGGAGGVELALGMRARLGAKISIRIIHRGAKPLDTHNKKVQAYVTEALERVGVRLLCGRSVTEITKESVVLDNGQNISYDFAFSATGSSPAEMLKDSGLALTEGGFIRVNSHLQSVSHPYVFAAGDIATIENARRPKSGVFAVRAAKPLGENLRRFSGQSRLISYVPQKEYLSLIGTGDKRAIASRGVFAAEGRLWWYVKDYIDRSFMKRLSVS